MDVRKLVTVVFTDLVDSSRLSAQLDPEALRGLMSRYFGEMSAVVDRHGGIVEKYIGDAILAVFGVPVLHEDDALRAVRAAAEMREALAVLNQDIERAWGLRLAARYGVNTGEVVAGDHSQGHLFVTGEAVNVAKRLEEAAPTNEILVGEATYRLVRDAVEVDSAGRREAKGMAAVEAHRLVEVLEHGAGHARRSDLPFVGRTRQLGALESVFEHVASDRVCHLQTVLGVAGVGKSRLVQEFVDGLGDGATVLRSRCLPYGESITYWPLAEIVHELTRVESIAERLAGEEKAELIAERVAEATGLAGGGGGKSDETFWAVRKLFELLARARPLVVVLDDVQWAEPTFLDLVEHVAEFSRNVPILLVCIARPELLDTRPGWGGGKLNAASILLEPLSEDECRELISNLLGRLPLAGDTADRLAHAAEGNALFAEELVAMLIDDELLKREDDRWVAAADLSELPVPATIHSLLAARLEALPDDERDAVTRASIEGSVFHRGAVSALSAGALEPTLDGTLMSLVRRDVIRPDPGSLAGEEAYRFRHVLIREAAYLSLPKLTRAELHERFADWLERGPEGHPSEYEEIVGYHLEQAYRSLTDLATSDEHTAALAARAARRLESAGRHAHARGDLSGAIGLLDRAADLLSADDAGRAEVLPELGAALIEAGRLVEAESTLAEAQRLAQAADDDCAEAHALVEQQFLKLVRVEGETEEAARVVEQVVPVFERRGDHHGLCRAWRLRAWLDWNAARAAAAASAWEQAAAEARLAGDEDERSEILNWIASSFFFGPVPVPEGIRLCEEIETEVSGNLGAHAWTLRSLAGLHAMEGRFELARSLLARSNAVFEELGATLTSSISHLDAIVELLAGNPAAAEESLQAGYRALAGMGDRAFLSTTSAYLAQAILAQGRDEEAERFTRLSEELGSPDDALTQVIWRAARARVLAGQGRLDEAKRLGREAVELAERTDFVSTHGDALLDLAHVLRAAGRLDEAGEAASEGLRLYAEKGNAVAAEKARSWLDALARV